MSSGVLIVAALALLCVALALVVLQRGAKRHEQASTERFMDSRMASTMAAAAPLPRVTATAGVPQGAAATTVGAGGPANAGSTAAGAAAAAKHAQAQAQARRQGGARQAGPQMFAPTVPDADADWQVKLQYARARLAYAWDNTLSRSGLQNARVPAVIAIALALLLTLAAIRAGGGLAGLVTLAACAGFFYFVLSMRAAKRRQAIVRQLPSFLDGIVRLIVLGNSVPAAFQAALQTTEAPLRDCLDRVSRMLRTGVEIDRALTQVAALYGTQELELLGSVLRLSVKYGGRADVMLDRMSSFMRDLEAAERELVAMSAETRMSAWVLALLPIGIGGFMILTNPRYFSTMWFDPTGRDLLYLAFGLQVLGAYLLFRLTRLRG